MTGEPTAFHKAVFALALGVATVGLAGTAVAGPETLREGLFRKPGSVGRTAPAPLVARYVSEEGAVFVLDRSQPGPLLKFDGDPEVWVLQGQPAPRGDVIYKNDMGEPVLRATRLGGITLFTDNRPGGAAVALTGGGQPLRLAPLSPQSLIERLGQASVRASRAARRTILFEAEATPASSALIADAATITSVAVVRISQRRDGRLILSRLRSVLLIEGRRASATVAGEVMRVTVTPGRGLAGRPSSDRITAALAAAQ